MPKLTKRLVEAIEPGTRDVFAWDTELKGFGVRVYPSGQRRYLLQWKRNGKTRRYVIGAHGPLTTEQARVRAVKLLGRIANGDDPAEERDAAKADLTVRELIDLYLTEGAAHLKGGSRAAYRSVFVRHVLPLLGGQKARTLKSADIVELIDDVANGVTAGWIEGGV